jgi:AcrR family transcriptional regulator
VATGSLPERSARDRLLDTASELFYRDGFHAVGIDTIVERSGVAKMTLYRHFPSKDDLIAAYLERANREFWEWLEAELVRVHEPKAKLVAAFEAIARLATSTRCLGCTFQAAASEFPELEHKGHQVALDHKRRVLDCFAGLARGADLRDPDRLAAHLLLLMDGAWVAARMFGPSNHAATVAEAAKVLIDAHRVPIDIRRASVDERSASAPVISPGVAPRRRPGTSRS